MDNDTARSLQLSRARQRILWLLTAGAILLLILLVAGALTLILVAGGDDAGAHGVLGVVYVASAALLLDGVGLVVITASCVALIIERQQETGD